MVEGAEGGVAGSVWKVGGGHRNETSKSKKVPNSQELIIGNCGHYSQSVTLNKSPWMSPSFISTF